MAFDKNEIMNWSAEDKRNLAFELLDSIDEEMMQHELPAWKKQLIQKRIEKNKTECKKDVIAWEILRDKYKR